MTPQNPWQDELECEAVRSPESVNPAARPQAESISLASVWQMESPEMADAALTDSSGIPVYRRDGHPNEWTLAEKLSLMHGAKTALMTAQGMSAIAAVALSVLKPGASVWVSEELYGKSTRLFKLDLQRWGVNYVTFDPTDPEHIENLSSHPAELVLVETLSNPRLKHPDLRALAAATHAGGGILVVDNTFATHLLCRPLDFDADIVVESLGKQVCGHSDAMAGLIAVKDPAIAQQISGTISTFGMASSPLDCFLTQRGLATLAVRMERACRNAQHLANCLNQMSLVLSVDYPGLPAHRQHVLAARQLRGGFGWMLTFRLDLSRPDVSSLFEALRPEIPFVPSLGDVCTSVSHPATTSHRGLTAPEREALGIHEGSIRVSCGIEPTDWLVDRFVAAIEQIH